MTKVLTTASRLHGDHGAEDDTHTSARLAAPFSIVDVVVIVVVDQNIFTRSYFTRGSSKNACSDIGVTLLSLSLSASSSSSSLLSTSV